MWKKFLRIILWLMIIVLVICVGFFTYFFDEIKKLDSTLKPEGKPFGYGLFQFNEYNQMMWAIWEQDRSRIDYLIKEKGYDPAKIRLYSSYGSSNLMRVYLLGSGKNANPDFVAFLISRGFSADDCDQGFLSPIYATAMWGNVDVAEVLLKNGAKVNCPHKDKTVPLTVALQFKYCDFAKYLVKKGASLDGIREKDGFEKRLKDCYK